MVKHVRSNLFIFLPLLLLAIGLFFTFVLSQQSQETRSQAASTDVKLSLTTSSDTTLRPLDTFPVSVLIDTKGKKVGKLVLELTYPKNALSVATFTPGTFFSKSSNKSMKDGVAKITLNEDCTGNACVGLQGAGIVATLQMKVDKNAPSGETLIQINKKSDLYGINKKRVVPYTVKNLKFTIKGKAKPRQTPTETPEETPIETPEPTSEDTPEPTSEETPEPTSEDTPEATPSGTITPTLPPEPTPATTPPPVVRLGFPDTFVWITSPASSFTPEEREYIANNYKVILIGSGHANWDLVKVHEDANALKALNSDLEIYPYFSASFRFDKEKYGDKTFKNQWYLKDKNGKKLSHQKGAADYVDLSKSAYRKWAIEIIKGWMTKAPYSGILLDDVDEIEGKKKQWVDKLSKKDIKDWNKGLSAFVSEVKQAVGSKKVIFNGIDGNENLDFFTLADGAVNDDFCFNKVKGAFDPGKEILTAVNIMQTQASKGKQVLEKVRYLKAKDAKKELSDEMIQKIGRMCFGAFLLGYEPDMAFFKFGPGFRSDLGEFINAPETALIMGLPKGSYELAELEEADEEGALTPTGKIVGTFTPFKKKHKKKNPKKKPKPNKDAIAYRRLFDNGWVFVNIGNVPFATSVPERLTVGNGGMVGEVYEPGDLITIPVHDAVYLVKDSAFVEPPDPPETCIPGDLNCDGNVDGADYNRLVTDFGKIGAPGFIPSDIDKSGEVDIFDYNILVTNWTEEVPD